MNIIVFYNSIMGVFYTFVAKLIHKKILWNESGDGF